MFYFDCMENPFFYRHYAPLIAPNWCAPFLMFPRIQEGEPGAKSYPGHSSASTPNVQNIKHVKWKNSSEYVIIRFKQPAGHFWLSHCCKQQDTDMSHFEWLWMAGAGGGRLQQHVSHFTSVRNFYPHLITSADPITAFYKINWTWAQRTNWILTRRRGQSEVVDNPLSGVETKSNQ